MKIFASHSTADKPLVDALATLIRVAFVEPVQICYSSASVSEGGPQSGEDWFEWILSQVRMSQMTIVMLTPPAKARPWLLWESGAVMGASLAADDPTPIVPLLFGLPQAGVPGPLQSRQAASGTSEPGMRNLLETVRKHGALTYKNAATIDSALHAYLTEVNKLRVPGMFDLFLSCPMVTLTKNELVSMVQLLTDLENEARNRGYSVYCAALRTHRAGGIEQENVAAATDLEALRASRNFLMIFPKPVVSSCLLEAGYALVAEIPSTYFVRNAKHLPYLLRGAVESFRNARRQFYVNDSEILSFFRNHPERIIDGAF